MTLAERYGWGIGVLFVIVSCEASPPIVLHLPAEARHQSAALLFDDGIDVTLELVSLQDGRLSQAITQPFPRRVELTAVLWPTDLHDLGLEPRVTATSDLTCPLPEGGASIWQTTVDHRTMAEWSSATELSERLRGLRWPCGLSAQLPVCRSLAACNAQGSLRFLLPYDASASSILIGFASGALAKMERNGACEILTTISNGLESGYRNAQGGYWFGTSAGTVARFTASFTAVGEEVLDRNAPVTQIQGALRNTYEEIFGLAGRGVFRRDPNGIWTKVYDVPPTVDLTGITLREPGQALFGLLARQSTCLEDNQPRFSDCPSFVPPSENRCPPFLTAEQWSVNAPEPLTCLTFPPSILAHSASALMTDPEGGVWLASRLGGVFYLAPEAVTFRSLSINNPTQAEIHTVGRTPARVWFFNELGDFRAVFDDTIVDVGANNLTMLPDWHTATISGTDKIVGNDTQLLWYSHDVISTDRACP